MSDQTAVPYKSALLDELDESEGAGRGNIFGFVDVVACWLATGLGEGVSQADRIFQFNGKIEADKKAAYAKCEELIATRPIPEGKKKRNNPIKGVLFRVHKASAKGVTAKGEPAGSSWQGDRLLTVMSFTDGYKEVTKPSLVANRIDYGAYWAEIGWKPDPTGRTQKRKNEQGEEEDVPEYLPLIVRVFANEMECAAAAPKSASAAAATDTATEASGNGSTDFPPGWDAKTWAKVLPQLKAALKGGATPAKVAGDYGIPPKFVAALEPPF